MIQLLPRGDYTNEIINMKTQAITAKNLLHVFKKKLINAQELNTFLKLNPGTSRRVGSLPVDFFSNIKNNSRSEITQKVGDIFEKFSIDTALVEETHDIYLYGIKNAAENMVSALKSLLNRDDIETNYVDSGSFKNCQRLKVGNFSYALATFKKYPLFDIRGYFRESHGKGNEPQNIFTSYNRFSQGRVCRPFLANLSAENDEGGFILSKFIDNDHSKKNNLGIFLYNRSYLKNIDSLGNSINGIFIEAGGFIPNKKYIKDPQLRYHWKKFAECLDNNSQLLEKSNANDIQDKLIKAIENTTEADRTQALIDTIFELPKEESKIATKLLKQYFRIKALKTEAQKNGSWNEIQKLLKEDLMDLFPFDEFSFEFNEAQNVSEIYKGYPRLLTKELGIDNLPSLKDLLFLLDDHGGFVEFDFTKYYTIKEIKDLFAVDYDTVKGLYSFQDLQDYLKQKIS